MTIEETQKAITELEANRAAHVEVMRPISEEFVALVAADLPARWDTMMSQWVDKFADIVEGLDDSELKQLKSSVADLSASAEEVARPHSRKADRRLDRRIPKAGDHTSSNRAHITAAYALGPGRGASPWTSCLA